MKKAIKIFAIFAVLILFVSAHTDRVYKAEDGFKAPYFEVSDDSKCTSTASLKGKYVLINFWSSEDAESRIQAQRYDRYASDTDDERFCLLSVNFDRSERLFREIVRRDNLSAESLYNVQASAAKKIADAYQLHRGYRSFLVNPQGQIVATNPSMTTLNQILSD